MGPLFTADDLAKHHWSRDAKAEAEAGAAKDPVSSGVQSWGSALSLMLFGPLAMSTQSPKAPETGGRPPSEMMWHTWCFHDTELLTEDGVMPEVAALREEVHAASWQTRSDSNGLLDTDATWRFPDLVPRLHPMQVLHIS